MRVRTLGKVELDYSKVIIALFELLLDSGISATHVASMSAAALEMASRDTRRRAKAAESDSIAAGLVLDAWHRDRSYLDSKGKPKSVRLLGPKPSVQALVRSQGIKKNNVLFTRKLRNLGLLLRTSRGQYVPCGDAALISKNDPLVIQHTAKALSMLLETVGRNVNTAQSAGPLIERTAEIPDLPESYIAEFEQFTQLQGRIFVRTVNDWLESRRAARLHSGSSVSKVRAGVHTYAYVGQSKKSLTA
ncbi:MAG: hypothetical protein JSS29_16540 [Proteobacteria bacterium]|nr:hypothetical protein [Pseudomonadota bacterium]